MSAKNIRNLIVALVILAVGIRVIMYIAITFFPDDTTGIATKFIQNISQLADNLFLAVIIFALILVPFYLSARSNEKEEGL